MSVRVMNKGTVEGSGYVHGMSYISMIESPLPPTTMTAAAAAEMFNGDRRFSVREKVVVVAATGKEEISREEKKVNTFGSSSSSTTSSIGKNSDLSSGEKSVENSGDNTDHEVQSPYKGPLNAMEALEEVLPIRRGISRFYNGKSKSFASLADASSTKELAKPENAYMRRRRNLLASSSSCLGWDKNRSSSSFLKSNGGGVSKKVVTTTATANRTTALALAVFSMSGGGVGVADSSSSAGGNNIGKCSAYSRLNPNNFAPWRSYSLVDLQQCVTVTAAAPAPTTQSHTTLDMKPSQT